MASKLSWKPNVENRCNKAWKAFYFLKRYIYSPAAKNTKLNSYVGYVIHVIIYVSTAWFVNKTESKEIERVQSKATSWIMVNWDESYKEKLTELRLLPLSYYFELNDLLMLVSMLKGGYNIELPIKSNTKPINKRKRSNIDNKNSNNKGCRKFLEENRSINENNSKKRTYRPRTN